MGRHIVLLRGINVGGRNKLPMADLRASLGAAGFSDVITYIQSGNVALEAPACRPEEISAVIERDFGLQIPVVVKTKRALTSIIDGNPFPEAESEPKRLLVYFCNDKLPRAVPASFDDDRYAADRLATNGKAVYVAYDEGLSASKLDNSVIDRTFGTTTTGRNWSTVLKLAEMANP